MSINVPFLSAQEIERSAMKLLGECRLDASNYPGIIVPVEKILEEYLGLTLDFDDLHAKLGVPMTGAEPEVLGALWVKTREVFIDQSLDPDENPEMEGRYRFTVSHEIAHWCLHRELIDKENLKPNSNGEAAENQSKVICRASNSKDRIEWQADAFASSLLMPATHVLHSWREAFSRSGPLVFADFENNSNWTSPPMGWVGKANFAQEVMPRLDVRAASYFFYRAARELAPNFGVSVQAMQHRLENLGLLLIDRPRQRPVASTLKV